MPRRRPSRLRADSRRFAAHHHYSRPGRLSGPAQARIVLLERTRLHPGAIERALASWTALARTPKGRLPSPSAGNCGVPECCPQPADERDLLELAMHALPRKSARELRALVTPLDLRILEHPEVVPHSEPPPHWWHRAF
ncbi:hypothetical protein U5640_25910 [Streptomyces sp. SS7]|uniref:hypothetical protein n=1 Tax=Streptomyces sp. SS7 TaxID=3108485 RepID=UPI0030EE8BA9